MSEQKHTPGPWVRSLESPKIIMSGSFIGGHQGYIVGSVTGNDNSGYFASEGEAEANASLIVAAPELLALSSASLLSTPSGILTGMQPKKLN
ncbi:hypothetical protein [Pseudomonas putida]|uniref:Uncharacterized protein n=1 Tax=Pseudomonas putida TaxID=303 RepID=A0A177SAR3_PSEPU|nr:hypothetical protein [Pseudomonas putida]OAI84912.1 hypothetical protein AYO28_03245 [Pseudomonas putida]